MADEPTRKELDERALREHIAANPTPPSGPHPVKEVTQHPVSPPKTTEFRRRDGSLLMRLTFTHTFSKMTRVCRARGSHD